MAIVKNKTNNESLSIKDFPNEVIENICSFIRPDGRSIRSFTIGLSIRNSGYRKYLIENYCNLNVKLNLKNKSLVNLGDSKKRFSCKEVNNVKYLRVNGYQNSNNFGDSLALVEDLVTKSPLLGSIFLKYFFWGDTYTNSLIETVGLTCKELNSFSGKNLSGNINLRPLHKLKNLTSLNLIDITIMDKDLKKVVKNCKQLKKIHVPLCKGLTEKSGKVITESKLPLLELNVEKSSLCFTKDKFDKLIKCMTTLKVLHLGNSAKVLEELNQLPEKLTDLRSFAIGNCNISMDFIPNLLKKCKKLKNLELTKLYLNDLPKSQFKSSEKCPNLKSLTLNDSITFTDSDIEDIANRFPRLVSLNIVSARKLTDKSIVSLTKNKIKLKSFTFSPNDKLPLSIIDTLIEKMPSIKKITVYFNLYYKAMNQEELDNYKQKYPNIINLCLRA